MKSEPLSALITAHLQAQLEKALAAHRVPKGFVQRVLNGDDWSAVILLHTLLEAAITHAVVAAIGRPKLQPVLSRIGLGNDEYGRLEFVRHLDLIPKDCIAFVRRLSRLRNQVAHDVSETGFTFAEFACSLDANQLKSFHTDILAPLGLEHGLKPAVTAAFRELARTNPKNLVVMSSLVLVARLYRGAGHEDRFLFEISLRYDRLFDRSDSRKAGGASTS
jgi:hypothetical protein